MVDMETARAVGGNGPRRKKGLLNARYPYSLPVVIKSSPVIIPHNPISVLYFIWDWLISPWFSGKVNRINIKAIFDSSLQTIKVYDADGVHILWTMGFFGKGTLSRSEATWYSRTEVKLISEGIINDKRDPFNMPSQASEDITRKRREERKKFKQERAKTELLELRIRLQLENKSKEEIDKIVEKKEKQFEDLNKDLIVSSFDSPVLDKNGMLIQNEEYQLMFEEAFFLAFGLGILTVYKDDIPITELNDLFYLLADLGNKHIDKISSTIKADNNFIVRYVVYHHYRSLGWCVRNGIKFGTDFILYRRGPPFSHAEFAIQICLVYPEEDKNDENRMEWWKNSGLIRVINTVKKTLVLCYVTIPKDFDIQNIDVYRLLKHYHVREVITSRWVPSRNRD